MNTISREEGLNLLKKSDQGAFSYITWFNC